MKITSIIVAAWLATSSDSSVEGRLLRRPKGQGWNKNGEAGKKTGKQNFMPKKKGEAGKKTGKQNFMPCTKQSVTNGMDMSSIFNPGGSAVTDNLFGNLLNQESDGMNPEQTEAAVDPFANSLMDEIPDLIKLLNIDLQPDDCPTGSETLTEEGNTKVEGSIASVGLSGVTKSSFSCIKNKQGKVIELVGTTFFAGEADLGDGIGSRGVSSTKGTTRIDHDTGILTYEGESRFSGATFQNGTLLFSGDTGSKGSESRDCSNNQCVNGGTGQVRRREGSAWIDGKSVSLFGTFIGSASSSGNFTIDYDGIVTLEGTAGFHGSFSNDFETIVGTGRTGGFLKHGYDESFEGKIMGGYAEFQGNNTNKIFGFEFDGYSRSEGFTALTSDIIRLEGNATAHGKFTSGSFTSDGNSLTGGYLELDRNNFNYLSGGGGFAQFNGTSKDEVTCFEFTGFASCEGSITLQDGSYFLEGTAQANGVSVTGNVTVPLEIFDQLVADLPAPQ